MGDNLSNILKAIADENRLRILCLLREKPLYVCELESILGTTQSNVSRHLAKLKDKGIIDAEKKAQFVRYRLNEEILKKYPFVLSIIEEASKTERCKRDIEVSRIMNPSGVSICKIKKPKL
jgi:ArsR family transcriptional regulator